MIIIGTIIIITIIINSITNCQIWLSSLYLLSSSSLYINSVLIIFAIRKLIQMKDIIQVPLLITAVWISWSLFLCDSDFTLLDLLWWCEELELVFSLFKLWPRNPVTIKYSESKLKNIRCVLFSNIPQGFFSRLIIRFSSLCKNQQVSYVL